MARRALTIQAKGGMMTVSWVGLIEDIGHVRVTDAVYINRMV